MLIFVLGLIVGAVAGMAFIVCGSDSENQTEDVIYAFQVNGQRRYEPELPPASERDAGPFTVYYGYPGGDND